MPFPALKESRFESRFESHRGHGHLMTAQWSSQQNLESSPRMAKEWPEHPSSMGKVERIPENLEQLEVKGL